ncbi:MAG: 2-amino-4-hydroxy-6-hydroxymethyldihydropteridine diphosphokinase [Campylobacterales bacterium]|nr:2-amino-4-hydroxy-6-hydroxymethyldihydropteridine diphosphokinase [Campylobacterales bacterium]
MYSKNLGNGKHLFRGLCFPWATNNFHTANIVYLGIGGNIGDTKRRFQKLFWLFRRDKVIDIIQTSPILKNPPFGFLDQSDFYNAIIKISTSLEPKKLLRYLLQIEKRFRRQRSFKDAPRTLDIDMIFYNDVVMQSKILTLPHPHWYKRASVVIPLMRLK